MDESKAKSFVKKINPKRDSDHSKHVKTTKTPEKSTIKFTNLEVKDGGIYTIKCTDEKTPLNKIQVLEIEVGQVKHIYKRI